MVLSLCFLLEICDRLQNPCDQIVKQAVEIISIHWEAALSSHVICRLSSSVFPSLDKNQDFVQHILTTDTDAY